MPIDFLLYVTAMVLFILAALPLNLKVRCEWLAFAALTLTMIV